MILQYYATTIFRELFGGGLFVYSCVLVMPLVISLPPMVLIWVRKSTTLTFCEHAYR